MKTCNIVCILLVWMNLPLIGQTTVQTPWGTSVNVTTPSELDVTSRAYWDSIRKVQHPQASFQKTWPVYPYYPNLSSSGRFNCHGYAWHMYWFGEDDELDEPVKMEYTAAENYFNDPSFKECTQSEADIWWFNGGTHSAVATDQTNMLKSKWDIGPLAVHYYNDHPYTPINTIKYYKVCLYETSGTIYSDITMDYCAVKLNSVSVSSYVDLEIQYEEGVLINGPFSTGTGATLYFHPD